METPKKPGYNVPQWIYTTAWVLNLVAGVISLLTRNWSNAALSIGLAIMIGVLGKRNASKTKTDATQTRKP
ncbi:MAG: hypothetical protein ABIY70_12700 [Capsulimonas sp.]|uniref:hypothetical protein n=1 Tax=Capsulimonas sp. TaxID=2494211 RepID=UPI0032657E23